MSLRGALGTARRPAGALVLQNLRVLGPSRQHRACNVGKDGCRQTRGVLGLRQDKGIGAYEDFRFSAVNEALGWGCRGDCWLPPCSLKQQRRFVASAACASSFDAGLARCTLHLSLSSAISSVSLQLSGAVASARAHRRPLTSASTDRSLAVLVIAEHVRGRVVPATWAALRAAQQVAAAALHGDSASKRPATIEVLVFDRAGSEITAVRDQLLKVDGVTRLVLVREKRCLYPLAEMLAPVIARWSAEQGYSHVLVGGSTFGKNILPRAAGILGVQPLSDIMEVCSPWEFVRPMYAGSILARVRFVPASEPTIIASRLCMATIRGTAFEPAQQRLDGERPLEQDITSVASQFLDEASPPAVEWVHETSATVERPRLESASIVVTGGRGVQDAAHFDQLVVALADRLGAAVGATRAAVDSGMCANELQVGQTGKIVAPDLYIAIGVSGAIQHLAGMKDSKVVVAINKDPEAPIFQAADYGLVGDLFDIVPALLEKLGMPQKRAENNRE